MKQKKIVITLIFITTLLSCDCWTDGNGIVYDAQSNKPLDSVLVESYVEKNYLNTAMYTSTTGEFWGSTDNIGRCKDLHIVLTKPGYKTKTVINPYNLNVYLEK